MGNKLIVQLILIITSIVIIVTYIKPQFEGISAIQDDISQYRNTVSKASELNAALQQLISVERSLSNREVRNLQTYLPSEINDVMVMRDIENIFKVADVTIVSLQSVSSDTFTQSIVAPASDVASDVGSDIAVADQSNPSLAYKDFQLDFFGTYEDLKLVLQGLEINAYPLEVVELEFSSESSDSEEYSDIDQQPGVMYYTLGLRTFALPVSQ